MEFYRLSRLSHAHRWARFTRLTRHSLVRWWEIAGFVVSRILEERLQQVASSLTFTTVLALVPMLTIALAIFTAFPLFAQFRGSLEGYFVQNLMPIGVAQTVLDNLNEFANKSARLSAVGGAALLVTSGLTMSTIDQVFNRIWRVQLKRPLLQRMLVYWAIISLGPVLVGISLTTTSWIVSATGKLLLSTFGGWIYSVLSVLLTSFVFSLLYVVVPNTPVLWRDALWGGVLAGVGTEVVKHVFALYIIRFPTYTIVYGALAALPIFLVWLYVMWMITLVGAQVAAAVPLIKDERWWHVPAAGSEFVDAMAMLALLYQAHSCHASSAVTLGRLRRNARLGIGEAKRLLDAMRDVGWISRVEVAPGTLLRKRFRRVEESEKWTLIISPAQLRLSDIYRLFAFDTQAAMRVAPALGEIVDRAATRGLSKTLEQYCREQVVDASQQVSGEPTITSV